MANHTNHSGRRRYVTKLSTQPVQPAKAAPSPQSRQKMDEHFFSLKATINRAGRRSKTP